MNNFTDFRENWIYFSNYPKCQIQTVQQKRTDQSPIVVQKISPQLRGSI